MHKILITDFSSYKAIVIARFIRRYYPGCHIVTTDHRRFTRLIRSRFSDEHILIATDGVDASDYPEKLADIVAKAGVDWVIPVNSQEIGGLLAKRELFGESLSYWGPQNIYDTLHDKALLHIELRKIGVAVPWEYPNLDDVSLPIVIKPTTASASKGVRYVTTQAQLDTILREEGTDFEGHVIQSYIDGEGAGFSGFFTKGSIDAAYAHIRLGEFPTSGGSSVYRGPLPKEYAEQCEAVMNKVLTHMPWSGFAMFEFKLTSDGRLVFIECNPRIWGSVHQGLANGVNYFSSLLGVPEREVKVPARQQLTFMSPLIWASLLSYFFKGRFGFVARFITNSFRNRVDVGVFSDPMGWLSLLGRIVKS